MMEFLKWKNYHQAVAHLIFTFSRYPHIPHILHLPRGRSLPHYFRSLKKVLEKKIPAELRDDPL